MKLRAFFLILLFSFCGSLLFAQFIPPYVVTVQPVVGDTDLVLSKKYTCNNNKDTISIETFRMYFSGIELLQKDKVVWAEKNSYHLIDIADSNSLQIFLSPSPMVLFDAIRLHIGVDSITNVSGAMGGDLDPTKGMYWTWQNGYINFKVEGKSNACPARDQLFQFHIGGYMPPFKTLQTVSLACKPSTDPDIYIDLGKFMQLVDVGSTYDVVAPGRDAVTVAEKFSSVISIR